MRKVRKNTLIKNLKNYSRTTTFRNELDNSSVCANMMILAALSHKLFLLIAGRRKYTATRTLKLLEPYRPATND